MSSQNSKQFKETCALDAKTSKLDNLTMDVYNGYFTEVYMQHALRTISSSDAKANLGDVLSSLNTQGPIEITRNGKSVGLLTLPPMQAVDRNRLTALAIAYSKGLISWPQIAEETGASYGDLLISLGVNNLQIPKVVPKNRAEQIAFFNHILDAAAAKEIR